MREALPVRALAVRDDLGHAVLQQQRLGSSHEVIDVTAPEAYQRFTRPRIAPVCAVALLHVPAGDGHERGEHEHGRHAREAH